MSHHSTSASAITSRLTFNHRARVFSDLFILLRLPAVSEPQTENSLKKCCTNE